MATIIVQKPLFRTLTVGQDVIFTVSNNAIVSSFTKVKFVAEVHISSTFAPNLSNTDDLVGTFKTTPNNAGVGMFDFSPIIETFVNADNLARNGSAYKTNPVSTELNVPIHLIDKYSGNINTMRYLAIKFKIEYTDAAGDVQIEFPSNSDLYKIFNGYLKYTDDLDLINNNFGYKINNHFLLDSNIKKFLTNAPTTQYANIDDYGTVGLLMANAQSKATPTGHSSIIFKYYDEAGVQLGTTETVPHTVVNGGFVYPNGDIQAGILFSGVFPANLQNWSTIFNTSIANISYYTFRVSNSALDNLSALYRININCPTLKGFEPIRLTWLNQWGVWDYYTFNMKSTKAISTKGSTYTQLEGTWNEGVYRLDSFKGGKKSFRVNATEKISMNTDFVNESESEWFEELINSPEVYILEGFKTDANDSALNKYVTPVRLTTSSYTKKTVANDRLMQYTFEVEKTKTLRTQAI